MAEKTWRAENVRPEWLAFIEISFLSDELRLEYKKQLDERFGRLT